MNHPSGSLDLLILLHFNSPSTTLVMWVTALSYSAEELEEAPLIPHLDKGPSQGFWAVSPSVLPLRHPYQAHREMAGSIYL